MRQGAVGQVRLIERGGVRLVEKRMADAERHGTEVAALRALAHTDLPVPRVVEERPGSILMTLLPGQRLDAVDPESRLAGLRASAPLMRRLHALEPPPDLPVAPSDDLLIARYRDAGGPPLPLALPPVGEPVFCHGDWTDGNLLADGGRITGIVDWEAAHLGDPIRELSRAAWGAARKEPRSAAALVGAYGADPAEVRAWFPLHAAALWLWFAEAGPPEYLQELTEELRDWPG